MALKGNVTLYKYEKDLDNPYVEKHTTLEGEEKEVTLYPNKLVVHEVVKDVYVIVRMAAMHLENGENIHHDTGELINPEGMKTGYYIVYRYNIYENEEKRKNYFFQPLYERDEQEMIHLDSPDIEGNIFEFCYNHLKKRPGFDNLTNV